MEGIKAIDLSNERLEIVGSPGDIAFGEAGERFYRFRDGGGKPPRMVSRGAFFAFIALNGDPEEFKELVSFDSEDNERARLVELVTLERHKAENPELYKNG